MGTTELAASSPLFFTVRWTTSAPSRTSAVVVMVMLMFPACAAEATRHRARAAARVPRRPSVPGRRSSFAWVIIGCLLRLPDPDGLESPRGRRRRAGEFLQELPAVGRDLDGPRDAVDAAVVRLPPAAGHEIARLHRRELHAAHVGAHEVQRLERPFGLLEIEDRHRHVDLEVRVHGLRGELRQEPHGVPSVGERLLGLRGGRNALPGAHREQDGERHLKDPGGARPQRDEIASQKEHERIDPGMAVTDVPEAGDPEAPRPLQVELHPHEHEEEPPEDGEGAAQPEERAQHDEYHQGMRIDRVEEIADRIALEEPAQVDVQDLDADLVLDRRLTDQALELDLGMVWPKWVVEENVRDQGRAREEQGADTAEGEKLAAEPLPLRPADG